MSNRGDTDDLGLHREVLEYFSVKANHQAEANLIQKPDEVLLSGGGQSLAIDADVFAGMWANAFWISNPQDPYFKAAISTAGVNSLVLAATRLGLLDVASKLQSFRALHGGDATLTQGSHRWSPLVRARNAPGSLDAHAANAAGREGVFADVLAFFDKTSHAQHGA